MAQPTNFAIMHCSQGNQTSEYAQNTTEQTYVASSIKIALDMMSSPHSRSALIRLALEFDATQASAWYGNLNGDLSCANQLIDDYLAKITAHIPAVYVDDKITDPNDLAFHPRGSWSDSFDPRRQAVCINAQVREASNRTPCRMFDSFQRVRDMVRSSMNNQRETIFEPFSSSLPTTSYTKLEATCSSRS